MVCGSVLIPRNHIQLADDSLQKVRYMYKKEKKEIQKCTERFNLNLSHFIWHFYQYTMYEKSEHLYFGQTFTDGKSGVKVQNHPHQVIFSISNLPWEYTAACGFSLTASYYAHQCYQGLIRNIGVYLMGCPVHTNMFYGKPDLVYRSCVRFPTLSSLFPFIINCIKKRYTVVIGHVLISLRLLDTYAAENRPPYTFPSINQQIDRFLTDDIAAELFMEMFKSVSFFCDLKWVKGHELKKHFNEHFNGIDDFINDWVLWVSRYDMGCSGVPASHGEHSNFDIFSYKLRYLLFQNYCRITVIWVSYACSTYENQYLVLFTTYYLFWDFGTSPGVFKACGVSSPYYNDAFNV